jgi:hypothetical protein
MAPSQPSLPTGRAFVMQLRGLPPGTSAAYGAQAKHLISGQVVCCHLCGVPMSSPRMGLSGVGKPFHTRAI